MAIQLELTPEIEERLMAQATEQGMTVESFLKVTIENLLNTKPSYTRLELP
jgi:predicted DNA-binding protein